MVYSMLQECWKHAKNHDSVLKVMLDWSKKVPCLSFFGGHLHALKVIWSCLNLPEIQVKVANRLQIVQVFGSTNELSTHLLTGWSKQTCKTHWHRIAESYLWTTHLGLCDPPLVEASFLKQMFMILGGKVPVFPHYTDVSKYWVLEIQLVFNHLKEGFTWGGCERSTMVRNGKSWKQVFEDIIIEGI